MSKLKINYALINYIYDIDFNHIVLIIMLYHIETFFLKAFYKQYQNDV